MAIDVDLGKLLAQADEDVKTELQTNPEVVSVGDHLVLDDLAIEERRWAQVDEVVAIVADLKGSTKLGTGKHAASTASIYEAALGPLADILLEFGANDIDIQGDGAVSVFWGDGRLERAFCAGVTVKTFSQRHLQERLEKKWPDVETGFKVGMAASRILVKRVGVPRKPDSQEEVWVGKAVNYAAKAAQCSNRNEMWVTGSVWERLKSNDYIAYTCGCNIGYPTDTLWTDVEIDRLPDEDVDRYGRKLTSMWCEKHGEEFCAAILAGKTDRPGLGNARFLLAKKLTTNATAQKRERARQMRVRRLGSR